MAFNLASEIFNPSLLLSQVSSTHFKTMEVKGYSTSYIYTPLCVLAHL